MLFMGLSSFRLLSLHIAEAYDNRIPDYAAEILTQQSGGDMENWVTNTLPSMVGMSSPDWYCMALSSQGGYDLTAYQSALQTYLTTEDEPSATSRERLALSLLACSADIPAVCGDMLEQSAGEQGIMSWIFALHLLNNGVPSQRFTAQDVAETLIARQCADGGWSLPGTYGDPDVTAMAMQALAPNAGDGNVSAALERGVQFLSGAQLSSGAYRSYGTENPESTAQVWIALCCMGIDPLNDGRFIKDGSTLLDGILQYRIGDGQYAHTAGGGYSAMATVQTFLAYTAEDLLQSGKQPLFLYRNATDPVTEPEQPAETEPPVQTRRNTETQPRETQREQARQTTPPAHADQTDSRQDAQATQIAAAESAGTEGTAQRTSVTGKATAKATSSVTETSVSAEESTKSDKQETAAERTTVTVQTEPEEIHTTAPPADTRTDREKYPYRIPMTAGAAVIFGGAALIFFLRHNRSWKTYATLAGGCAAVIGLIWVIRVESPAQFYQSEQKTGGGTVTMAIRCDVICGMEGSERYPADGVIMPLTEFSISEGENGLELLYDAVKAYNLQIEVDGVSGDVVDTAYVRGIASLYEFDFGDLSGWTYTVNGERPDVGCGAYTLHDGDRVIWAYTVDL